MNEIYLSKQALSDLKSIQSIGGESTHKEVVNVLKRIRELGQYDGIGAPMSPVLGYESSYRFIISSNYLIFYRSSQARVYIDRVLFSRRDFIKIPFAEYEETT
ncbi:MAG: type II toxin-antitoxin system RelE/ParE family toxin [Eubacteriaceae bacterium]|nr:type II toxin-antitoxin system RelE/ParE family toxin [Eubacteriaceae bacterium]